MYSIAYAFKVYGTECFADEDVLVFRSMYFAFNNVGYEYVIRGRGIHIPSSQDDFMIDKRSNGGDGHDEPSPELRGSFR